MRRILILTMFSGENERDMCERAALAHTAPSAISAGDATASAP